MRFILLFMFFLCSLKMNMNAQTQQATFSTPAQEGYDIPVSGAIIIWDARYPYGFDGPTPSDGEAIDSIVDLSGNGNHAYVYVAPDSALYESTTGLKNSQPHIYFEETPYVTGSISDMNNMTEYTEFMLFSFETSAASHTFMCWDYGSTTDANYHEIYISNADLNAYARQRDETPDNNVITESGGNGTPPPSVWKYFRTYVTTGDVFYLYSDRSSVNSVTSVDANKSGHERVTLGMRGDNARNAEMKFLAYILFPSELSAGDISSIEDWLDGIWGATGWN